MNCQESQDIVMDVLYGEISSPRQVYLFHDHLSSCPQCKQGYLDLLETREILGGWNLEESVPSVGVETSDGRWNWPRSAGRWWPGLQKVAASVLIILGFLSILQFAGLWQRSGQSVSEEQMAEMIHDVMVARQVEDWKVIGSALLSLKEEVETQNRAEMRQVFEELNAVERRYVEVVEENNRLIQTMLTR